LAALKDVLNGYGPPEPYFKDRMDFLARQFFTTTVSHALPLLEFRDALSSLVNRLPQVVLKGIDERLAQVVYYMVFFFYVKKVHIKTPQHFG
jgi:hypothetical protein